MPIAGAPFGVPSRAQQRVPRLGRGRKLDEGEGSLLQACISRRDATAVLDLIEEPLDQIAAAMEIRAKADRLRAVPPKLPANRTYGGHRGIDANDLEQHVILRQDA